MNSNDNAFYQKRLHDAILSGDWDTLIQLRYDEGDPGRVCYIEDLDLSGRRLGNIPTEFLCFKDCNLSGASFRGKHFFPVSFWNCKAREIDLRNTSGMLFAYGCDIRDALFDNTTQLVVKNSDLPSAFKNCQMDKDFKHFLEKQGAFFDFPEQKHISQYAFGITKLQS